MTTKAISPYQRLARSVGPQFSKIAPEGLNWQSEREFFYAQLHRDRNVRRAIENGVEATIESAKVAARECAAMGLSMSPVQQLVYLIPRRMRKKYDNESKSDYDRNVPFVVNAHPSYRGLAYIATHYAGAEAFGAEVVYRADTFRYFGPFRMPEHEPTLEPKERTESKAIGVYAAVIFSSGIVRSVYIDQPTIAKIRARSEFPKSLLWTTFWTEGWSKAAIRRLAKTAMNTAPRMTDALGALDKHEGIVLEGEHNVPRGTEADGVEPEFENVPQASDPSRGMAGVKSALTRAQTRAREADAGEADVSDAGEPEAAREALSASHEPEVESEPEPARDAGDVYAEASGARRVSPAADYLDSPAASSNPPGSIEWWSDQIAAAASIDRLDAIRAAALRAKVNETEDCDAFREIYARRYRAIRDGTWKPAENVEPKAGELDLGDPAS